MPLGQVLGTMGVDHEMRVDFDKLRKDRLRKTREQMRKDDVGALLLFDRDNIRYTTSTKLGPWADDKMNRYALVTLDHDPILFEIGSAVPTKRMLCPWLPDIRPSKNDMKGSMTAKLNANDMVIEEIYEQLKDWGLEKAPIGIDMLTVPLVEAINKYGLIMRNGQATMQEAQKIKTDEEIQLLEISAAMVDGGYYDVVEAIKPGIRENEVAAVMYKRLFELGAENVHNVNCISGDRAFPHPHDFSDRIIRPNDLVFLDIVNDYMGYKTCYYRTFCCGYPSEKQLEVYKKTYDWMYAAIDKIKPGVTTDEICALWPTYKELGAKNEYETMALELGHGVGISHWSKPVIGHQCSMKYPEVIEKNMHFAVETYYGEEGVAARIEEQVVVTENGCRVITTFPCDRPVNTWHY